MPGELGPAHSLESSCRWDEKWKIGDEGAEYEFDIKIPPVSVSMTDEEFTAESDQALDVLAQELRRRYSWIGRVGRAGRSGGWLAVEDKKGLATFGKLEKIIEMVGRAKSDFVDFIETYYPEDRAKRVRRRR
jgi:hypothetical protein